MKKIVSFLALNLTLAFNAKAEGNLPTLECEVIQVAGNFNTFILPRVGEKLVLDLNRAEDTIQNSRIAFSHHGYISMNEMTDFKLEKISDSTHDAGGIRLSTEANNRKVTIEVLGHVNAKKLDAWIVNQTTRSKFITLGIMSLACTGVQKSPAF